MWPDQVGILIGELAGNAIQAGGRVRVEVGPVAFPAGRALEQPQFQREVPPGRYGRILVADTGRGIPPEVKGRLFEPFFTTKDGPQGLGLATVYGMVASNGGYIDVRSEPGRGTEVEVFFPQVERRSVQMSEGKRDDSG
jgi:signal transduction histidine kinase